MNTMKLSLIGIIGLIVITAFATIWYVSSTRTAIGSAPSGLPTNVATTSQFGVTTAALRVFATSTCDARVITTRAQPVMIGFSDVQGFVPTGQLGHLQAASTTVVYDSGQYGCGAVRILSAGAAGDTITVSEMR